MNRNLTEDDAAQKTLPHSDVAERAIIAGVILDNPGWESVAPIVSSADFYSMKNRLIFSAMAELVRNGDPIDLIAIRNTLENRGEIEAAGGVDYLGPMVDGTARSVNVAYYAQIVKEKAARRRIIAATSHLQHAAWNGTTPEDLARDIRDVTAIFEEAATSTAGADVFTWERLAVQDAINATPKALDWLGRGILAKGEAGVLNAGTGLGKTYITVQMEIDMAVGRPALGLYDVPRPLKILHVDEEMGLEMLNDRLTRQVAGSDLDAHELELLSTNLDIRYQQGLSLGDPEQFAVYDKTLREGCYDLVVMDSMVALSTGRENDADDARAFYRRCIAPYKGSLGTAFWILAHPPKPHEKAPPGAQFDPRGSGDKINAVDRSFYLELDSETITPDSFVLKVVLNRRKMRQGGSVTGQLILIDGVEAQPVRVYSLGTLGGEKAAQEIGKVNTCAQDILVKLRGAPTRMGYQPTLNKELEALGFDHRNHITPARNMLVNQGMVKVLAPIKGAPEGGGKWLQLTKKADD